MDRVHRIGQTKPVRVVRMVSADSVEDRILEIQEAKMALGKGALRKVKKRVVEFRVAFFRVLSSRRGGRHVRLLHVL